MHSTPELIARNGAQAVFYSPVDIGAQLISEHVEYLLSVLKELSSA